MIFLVGLFLSGFNVYALYHESGDQSSPANLKFEYSPSNPSVGSEFTAVFLALDQSGNKINHIDYNVRVIKDGVVVFERRFHDHEGDLKVIFVGGGGDISVSGSADEGGVYRVSGPVFTSSGEYTFEVSIVGIEFSPIDPITNTFTVTFSGGVQSPQPSQPSPTATPSGGGGDGLNLPLIGAIIIVAVIIVLLLVRRQS